MADKETSKNNPTKRRVDGWRCSACNHTNGANDAVCRGTFHLRVLSPNHTGTGMRTRMEHRPCLGAKK